MLNAIASNAVLDAAYAWLCEWRRDSPADSDVWTVRFFWPAEKALIRDELLAGRYRFEPLGRVTKHDG